MSAPTAWPAGAKRPPTGSVPATWPLPWEPGLRALPLSGAWAFSAAPHPAVLAHPRAPSESQQFLFPFTFLKLHCVET